MITTNNPSLGVDCLTKISNNDEASFDKLNLSSHTVGIAHARLTTSSNNHSDKLNTLANSANHQMLAIQELSQDQGTFTNYHEKLHTTALKEIERSIVKAIDFNNTHINHAKEKTPEEGIDDHSTDSDRIKELDCMTKAVKKNFTKVKKQIDTKISTLRGQLDLNKDQKSVP